MDISIILGVYENGGYAQYMATLIEQTDDGNTIIHWIWDCVRIQSFKKTYVFPIKDMGSSQISGFAPNIGVSCNSQFFQLWDGAKPATVEIFGMILPIPSNSNNRWWWGGRMILILKRWCTNQHHPFCFTISPPFTIGFPIPPPNLPCVPWWSYHVLPITPLGFTQSLASRLAITSLIWATVQFSKTFDGHLQ